MAIHRVEVIGVLDNHDPARVIRICVDDLAIGNRVDARAGGVALLRVPVLASMPPARIVPCVFNRDTVANKEAVTERPPRRPDWITKRRGSGRGSAGWSWHGCGCRRGAISWRSLRLRSCRGTGCDWNSGWLDDMRCCWEVALRLCTGRGRNPCWCRRKCAATSTQCHEYEQEGKSFHYHLS